MRKTMYINGNAKVGSNPAAYTKAELLQNEVFCYSCKRNIKHKEEAYHTVCKSCIDEQEKIKEMKELLKESKRIIKSYQMVCEGFLDTDTAVSMLVNEKCKPALTTIKDAVDSFLTKIDKRIERN